MARESKEVKVDGVRYIFTHYNNRAGAKLLAKLLRIVGRPIGLIVGDVVESNADLMNSIKDENSSIKLTKDGIGDMIGSLVQNVDPNDFDVLLCEILDGTTVFRSDGKNYSVDIDIDFDLGIAHMLKVVKEVLLFQFDFLGNVASSVAQEVAKTVRRVQAR